MIRGGEQAAHIRSPVAATGCPSRGQLAWRRAGQPSAVTADDGAYCGQDYGVVEIIRDIPSHIQPAVDRPDLPGDVGRLVGG